MRQSFSSASCAAGDSPCACKTTLQCVAGNANAPFCPAVIGPIVVDEVASTSDGTLQSNQKGAQVSTLHRGMTITASSSSPDLPMRNPFKASTRTTNTCTSSPTQFSRRFQITNQLLYQLSYAGKKDVPTLPHARGQTSGG